MGLEILKDRVPSKPNRRKITYQDGRAEYVTVEMADEPIEEGTAVNKDTFFNLRATNDEMLAGTSDTSLATPKGVQSTIDKNTPRASELESIEGIDNSKLITPATNICRVGDVTASIRSDFINDVLNGKYLTCNGQILDPSSYPTLNKYAQKVITSAMSTTSMPSGSGYILYTATNSKGTSVATTSEGKLLYSNDGSNWYNSSLSQFASPLFCLNDIFYAFFSSYKSLWYSTDGRSWSQCNTNNQITRVNGYAQLSNGYIGVFYNRYDAFRSSDNGLTWSSFTSNIPYDFTYMINGSDGRIYISTSYGIYASYNGTSWVKVYSANTNIRHICSYGNTILAVVGANYTLIASYNNGVTWNTILSETNISKLVSYGSTLMCNWKENNNYFIKTSVDGGYSWIEVLSTGTSYSSCTGIIYQGAIIERSGSSYFAKSQIQLPTISGFYMRVK